MKSRKRENDVVNVEQSPSDQARDLFAEAEASIEDQSRKADLLYQANTLLSDFINAQVNAGLALADEDVLLLMRILNMRLHDFLLRHHFFSYHDQPPESADMLNEYIVAMVLVDQHNPNIVDIDFLLARAKALLLNGHLPRLRTEQTLNLPARQLTDDTLPVIVTLQKLFGENFETACDLPLINHRVQDLAICFQLIGFHYIKLSNSESALRYFKLAIDTAMRWNQDEPAFYSFLSNCYYYLLNLNNEMRPRFDSSYQAIFKFGFNLFGMSPANDTSLRALELIYRSTMENFSSGSAYKLPFLMQIFEIIYQRYMAGAFTLVNLAPLAYFPESTFTNCMRDAEYFSARFLEMYHALRKYKGDFLRLSSHPEFIFAMQLDLLGQRERIAALENQLQVLQQAQVPPPPPVADPVLAPVAAVLFPRRSQRLQEVHKTHKPDYNYDPLAKRKR